MKILFVFPRPSPYNSQSVRELPSGGTEKAVIFLGEAFKKLGHDVQWVTTIDEAATFDTSWPTHIITQEARFFERFPLAKKIWWTHHYADQPAIITNAAFGRCFADKIVTLSETHAQNFRDNLRLESVTIGHGVWKAELSSAAKEPSKLIYASAPFRGLEKVRNIFMALKELELQATLTVCSSMGMYGIPEEDEKYQAIFDELRAMEGVTLKGALNQADLYHEFATAQYFLYPNIWPETYCLALDEALAHGCIPLVSEPHGAMRERVDLLDEERLETLISHIVAGKFPYPIEFNSPQDWLEIGKKWVGGVLK